MAREGAAHARMAEAAQPHKSQPDKHAATLRLVKTEGAREEMLRERFGKMLKANAEYILNHHEDPAYLQSILQDLRTPDSDRYKIFVEGIKTEHIKKQMIQALTRVTETLLGLFEMTGEITAENETENVDATDAPDELLESIKHMNTTDLLLTVSTLMQKLDTKVVGGSQEQRAKLKQCCQEALRLLNNKVDHIE